MMVCGIVGRATQHAKRGHLTWCGQQALDVSAFGTALDMVPAFMVRGIACRSVHIPGAVWIHVSSISCISKAIRVFMMRQSLGESFDSDWPFAPFLS